MSDTMKIPRPLFCRRQNDAGGRTKMDGSGDKARVKTRFSDEQEFPDTSSPPAESIPDRERR
jgi:hypothetical protein